MYCTGIIFYFTFSWYLYFPHLHEFILPIKEAVTPSKKEKKKVCLYMIRGCTPYAALCVLHIIHACSVHCCQLLCHVCIIL